jgi:predicted RNA methylase
VELTEDIISVLSASVSDGNLLRLQGQLDRKLYQRVDAVLSSAGAKWNRAKKAHVFPGSAQDAVQGMLGQGSVVTALERKQSTQFFETPQSVVNQLVNLADVERDHLVLEPSAGRGSIAADVAGMGATVDCIEIDPEYAEVIRSAGYARTLIVADFLTVQPVPQYDRVIMNPPFTRGADVRHVMHALKFVRPGGRLVAVMPASAPDRLDKAAIAFQDQVKVSGGWFDAVPAGSFKESGTDVRTVIAVVPVP